MQAFDVAGYVVDDDAERVDIDAVWQFLSTQAYWDGDAAGRTS